MHKYKVKFKVKQIFNIECGLDKKPKSYNKLHGKILDLISEDYDSGNMRKDEPIDEAYTIEEIEEINEFTHE